ncbi:MAG: hypothetical protein B6241_05160 [Spirochaetaceae bacterium 4572_59]|nr:MAG: hypothetical protein B6241_05160 [Spirochaetaceae bacterium 4572_59]
MSIRFLSGIHSVLPGLEEHYRSENNSYNNQQMKLGVLFILPGFVILLCRYFMRASANIPHDLSGFYPYIYSALIFAGLIMLLLRRILHHKLSLIKSARLQMFFIVLYAFLLMALAVLNTILQQELYAYLLLILFLSVAVWLNIRVYSLLSLLTLGLMLAVITQAGLDPDQFSVKIFQMLLYYAVGWFLYLSLTSLLMENFYNRMSLEEQYQQLATESITDPLTGLYNRKSLQEDLKKEWAKCQRKDVPFCIIMLDIDNFRDINESFGHTMGDQLIRELSSMLRNAVRLSDKVYRYGGEEFLILLPETAIETVSVVGERIRESVENQHFKGIHKTVTISMGIAQSEEDINIDILVNRADQNLSKAKENGRNRVEL